MGSSHVNFSRAWINFDLSVQGKVEPSDANRALGVKVNS